MDEIANSNQPQQPAPATPDPVNLHDDQPLDPRDEVLLQNLALCMDMVASGEVRALAVVAIKRDGNLVRQLKTDQDITSEALLVNFLERITNMIHAEQDARERREFAQAQLARQRAAAAAQPQEPTQGEQPQPADPQERPSDPATVAPEFDPPEGA